MPLNILAISIFVAGPIKWWLPGDGVCWIRLVSGCCLFLPIQKVGDAARSTIPIYISSGVENTFSRLPLLSLLFMFQRKSLKNG